MGVRNDVFEPLPKSGGEAREALLEKSFSDVEVESIDITPVEIIEWPARRRNLWLILSFALFNTIALITIYFVLSSHLAAESPLTPPSGRVFPRREYETRILHHRHLRPGHESASEWKDDGPKGNGFFMVEDPGRFGLPKGMKGGGDHKRYGVTWAHQYHCLWMLREEYWKFVANNSTLIGKSLEDEDADAAYMWHLAHCFDYLKQTITCNMDMTIEYPTNGGPRAINGYEIPHRCAKRSVYDRYLDEHAPDVASLGPNEILGGSQRSGAHGGG